MDINKSIKILKDKLLTVFSGEPPINVNLLYLENIDNFDSIIYKLLDYLDNCDLAEKCITELELMAGNLNIEAFSYPENRLQEVASHYFSRMLNIKSVKFLDKIATKDAGFDDAKNIQNSFLTYESFIRTHQSYPFKPEIGKDFVKADILTRILSLTDLLTNPSNFGFLIQNNEPVALRIVDFSSPDYTAADQNIFMKWLEGHSVNHYSSEIQSLLMKENTHNKLETAKEVMDQLMEIPSLVPIVVEYIQQKTRINYDEEYIECIQFNWKLFSQSYFQMYKDYQCP